MICYHFGPWWTRKGLVSSHQGSYSVAPSQTMGLKTKAAQSISRKVACSCTAQFGKFWPFTACELPA